MIVFFGEKEFLEFFIFLGENSVYSAALRENKLLAQEQGARESPYGERPRADFYSFVELGGIKTSIGKEYELNPTKDLIPVCPNCHAMLHRKDPPYDVNDLKELGKF